MRNSREDHTIGDIADIQGGGTPSTRDAANFGGNVPWLTPKDLSGLHDRYVARGELNLSQKGLRESSAKLLPANSVLVSSRAPIGYVAIAKNPIATNQGFRNLVLKPGFDPGYVYYWLTAHIPDLERLANGSTFMEISGSSLKKVPMSIPPFPEQLAIGRILGMLDDKIELNRRVCKTLETIAQTLFNSWFMDFDPVHAKTERRSTGLAKSLSDLFPNSFRDSELGEIPRGWRVGSFGDVAVSLRRSIQPADIGPEAPYIALEHMPRHSIALTEWEEATTLESSKLAFKSGEILFGKLRPYFHKVGIAPVDGVCSTDIVVLAPRSEDWFAFVLEHASSAAFVEYTTAGSTGTKMPRTSWNDMARYPVVVPPDNVAAAFSSHVHPLTDRIILSARESRTLASLRDTLLPKLLSGELRVKDAEHFVQESIS